MTWPKDRKSTRLNSSHVEISYAVFCLKKKKKYKFGIHTVDKKADMNTLIVIVWIFMGIGINCINFAELVLIALSFVFILFFFFNDTATTEIYTLSLHDALPI